jgi:sterol desaturase/sphingolipid hydroxylase (fatty acid hydroxylase superfamily)
MTIIIVPSLALLLFVALGVYLDARSRDWSRSGYQHYPPSFWAIAVFLFAVVFVPGYLVARANSRPRWASELHRR